MTTEHIKPALLRSYRTLLIPLIRVLLRNNVTFEEVVETVRQAVIEASVRDAESKNLRAADVAARTGVSEQEVERVIAESLDESPDAQEADSDRAIKVLEGWHRDQGYVGVYGLANELTEAEFKALSEKYAPDRSVEYVTTLLVDADCVRVTIDPDNNEKRIRCVSRTYVPKPFTLPQIERMGRLIASFVSTIDNNIHNLGAPRLEKRVSPASGLHRKFLDLFDEAIRERSEEFLYAIDNWLSSYHTEKVGGDDDEIVRTGVGVFHYIESEESRRSFNDVLRDKGLASKER
ncbi:MAG: DUF6502 family protein [Pseudomonadota bacterium]